MMSQDSLRKLEKVAVAAESQHETMASLKHFLILHPGSFTSKGSSFSKVFSMGGWAFGGLLLTKGGLFTYGEVMKRVKKIFRGLIP